MPLGCWGRKGGNQTAGNQEPAPIHLQPCFSCTKSQFSQSAIGHPPGERTCTKSIPNVVTKHTLDECCSDKLSEADEMPKKISGMCSNSDNLLGQPGLWVMCVPEKTSSFQPSPRRLPFSFTPQVHFALSAETFLRSQQFEFC